MHASVMRFIAEQVEGHGLQDASVLEVGSMNVNGTPRRFFRGEYLGIDMQEGPGVDMVLNSHSLDRTNLAGAPFGVFVCTEMLEHDDLPWVTLQNMGYHCNDGACLLLTCRGFDRRGCFPLHGYPDDIYRFTCKGVDSLLRATGWMPELVKADPTDPGVFAVAHKGTCESLA